MAGSIVVRTQNPRDITPDEAGEIAAAIRGLSRDSEVRVEEHERGGRGLTLFEVLYITLAGGAFKVGQIVVDETAKKITDIVVDWARQRFKGRKSESKRPVYLEIHVRDDLSNWVLKAVVIKNATDEPEDRTEEKQQLIRDFRKRSAAAPMDHKDEP
jgi:ribosomal protein L13E